MLLEQDKRSWCIAKLHKNATVANTFTNYTLVDYGFELIDSYVRVKWLDSKQVPQSAKGDNDTVMEHSDNDCIGEKDKITDDKGNEDGDSDGDDDAMDDRE